MEFLETVTLAEAFIVIGGAGGVIGGVIYALKKVWPFLRRVVHTVDALDAIPALATEMRDAVATVATLGGKVDTIHHEVTPNGGGSMKDELRRQSETLARLDRVQLDIIAESKKRDEEIQAVRDEQSRVADRLAHQADALLGVLSKDAPPPDDVA